MVSTNLWPYLKLQRHDKRREGTERFGTDASAKEIKQVAVAGRNMKSFFLSKSLSRKTKWCVNIKGNKRIISYDLSFFFYHT